MAYDNLSIGHGRAQTFSRSLVPHDWQWAWDGLVCAIPAWYGGAGPVDIVNQIKATQSGSIDAQAGPAGPEAIYQSGSWSDFGDIQQWGTLYGDMTLAFIHSPISTAQSCIWAYADTVSSMCPFALLWSFGANSRYAFWNDNNASGITSASTYSVGSRNLIIATRYGDHADNPWLTLVINGALEASGSVGLDASWDLNPVPPNSQRINSVGGYSTGYTGGGQISNVLLWNRALSDREYPLINANPWGPFSQKQIEYVFYKQDATLYQLTQPNEILSSSNLSGSITDIDEDPDAPDGLWLTATSVTTATSGRFGFQTPPGDPYGSQTFKAYVRKTAGAPTPTASFQLYQNGSLVRELLTSENITSTTGQLITASWNASELTGVLNGSDVEFAFSSVVGSSAGSTGALPAYSSQGTLNYSATMPATVGINVPAHSAGDLLLLLVLCRNTNNNGTLSSINTAGWTQIGGSGTTYGGVQNTRIGVGWKIGDGSETSVSITTSGGTTSDARVARVFKFTAANGFATPAVGNISSSLQSGTTASTSLSMPTVVPSGSNQLAVAVYASNVVATIGAATGESGGNWTEPVAESPGTANGTIGIQVSDQSGGATISGGSASVTSSQWVSLGFTLIPANIPGAAVNTVEIGALGWGCTYMPGGEPQVSLAPYTYYFSRMRA